MRVAARPLLLSGVVLLAAGWLGGGRQPPPQRLLPAVQQEPLQKALADAPFALRRNGVDYTIRPVADYDIAGLVVSRHDTRTWWDMRHWMANDYLNVVDVCLVWGANARDGVYRRMRFFSGQWTCYFSYRDDGVVKPEHVRALSNNHLLTDRSDIARRLWGLRVGDQVRLRGQLVSYSHHSGFRFERGTSTTREDQGDGACETLFVQQVEVLRPAAAWPRLLHWLGVLACIAGVLAWLRTPFSARAW